jgi:hypothetical protein
MSQASRLISSPLASQGDASAPPNLPEPSPLASTESTLTATSRVSSSPFPASSNTRGVPAAGGSQPQETSATGLAVGVVLGILAIVAVAILIWFVAVRRRRDQSVAYGGDFELDTDREVDLHLGDDDEDPTDDQVTGGLDSDQMDMVDHGLSFNFFGVETEEAVFGL